MNLFEDTYLTIAEPSEGLFKDKGSKFLSYAFPISSEKKIKDYLSNLKKEHFSARHHCYAYRLGADKQTYRVNDDGEPSNTAGKPILGQIQSKDLTNIIIIVVRYFGGNLLGISGLINAYKNAAADSLKNATIIENTVNDIYEIAFDYSLMNDIMKIIKDENLIQLNQHFELDCRLTFIVRKNNSDRIYNAFKKISNLDIKYLSTE